MTTGDAAGAAVKRTGWGRRSARTVRGKIGIAGVSIILLVVIGGMLFAPYAEDEIVGAPFMPPSADALLGTDYLGRDLLSRMLIGGRQFLLITISSTLLAVLVGGTIGLLVGIRRGLPDLAAIWFVDVFLSIPAMVMSLAILAALGSGALPMIIALTTVLLPGSLRIMRAATLDVSTNEYVEVALSRNDSLFSIAMREILPNVAGSVAADMGSRVAWAAIIASSLSFLGLGQAPPAADWGRMVSENRAGLLISPLSVVLPALAIALFTVSIACIADSIAQSTGRAVLNR